MNNLWHKKFSYRDENDGIWKQNSTVGGDDFRAQESFIKYINFLEPLFKKAQETCEFEFIATLIKFDNKEAGWDPFENLEQLRDTFQEITPKQNTANLKVNFSLFLYGLILEASEPYDTLANLLNIIEGDRYRRLNFPDTININNGRKHTYYPIKKITILKERAENLQLDLRFFHDFFDNDLRNAIFHSDYIIQWPEVRTVNPDKIYLQKEWMTKINQTFAYIDAYVCVKKNYIASYKEPKIIDPHPGFQFYPGGKIVTIIRKDYGVIGLTDSQMREGMIFDGNTFYSGMLFPYELELLKKGIVTMPASKIDEFKITLNESSPYLTN